MTNSESATSSIIGWVTTLILRWIWILVKLFIAACILVGAFKAISNGLPTLAILFDRGVFGAIDQIASLLIDKWIPLLVLIILVIVVRNGKVVSSVESNTTATKIGVIAIMDYLNIAVQTEGMTHIAKKGVMSYFKESIQLNILDTIFGTKTTDDAITAKAVRGGKPVKFENDLQMRRSSSDS